MGGIEGLPRPEDCAKSPCPARLAPLPRACTTERSEHSSHHAALQDSDKLKSHIVRQQEAMATVLACFCVRYVPQSNAILVKALAPNKRAK